MIEELKALAEQEMEVMDQDEFTRLVNSGKQRAEQICERIFSSIGEELDAAMNDENASAVYTLALLEGLMQNMLGALNGHPEAQAAGENFLKETWSIPPETKE